MVETKISRRLEASMAKITHELRQKNSMTSYIDRLVVELLRDECSFASQLITLLLPQGLNAIFIRHLEQYIRRHPRAEYSSAELFFTKLCHKLSLSLKTQYLGSAHLLSYALTKPETHTSTLAGYYCFGADDVTTLILQLSKEQKNDNIKLGDITYDV